HGAETPAAQDESEENRHDQPQERGAPWLKDPRGRREALAVSPWWYSSNATGAPAGTRPSRSARKRPLSSFSRYPLHSSSGSASAITRPRPNLSRYAMGNLCARKSATWLALSPNGSAAVPPATVLTPSRNGPF